MGSDIQTLCLSQDVLLRHHVDAASDQPLKAAVEALQRAGIHAPVLLAEAHGVSQNVNLTMLANAGREHDAVNINVC